MSNRIAVFNDGKVQQLSSPDQLYEQPVNSFVAEFIGENNTFAGEVLDISGGKCKVKLSNAEILAKPVSVKGKGEKTTISSVVFLVILGVFSIFQFWLHSTLTQVFYRRGQVLGLLINLQVRFQSKMA